ncbi:hypothetical protein NL676_002756 [Syzygium grande]|nr:hypothetical protein NL676_002756 [Syzygium grande]
MKNILTSKVALGVMILLFLMGTSMRPGEACRVLIKGREGMPVNNKEPSLSVLQILQAGTTPSPGNGGGYTPGSNTPASTTSTTNTKAFAGRLAMGVPPHHSIDRIHRSAIAANRK